MRDGSTTVFGELLQQHRLAGELTQEALAERAGMSDRSIRSLERSRNRPQRETARRLADALGLEGESRDRFLAAAAPSPRRSAIVQPPPSGSIVPSPPSAILGREREVAEIEALLAREDIGLLTLTGPAGVGKTRLALEIARRVAGNLADGAGFLSLAPLSDPTLVLATVAREFHCTEGSQELLPRLVASLQGKHLLLVLDNFEHVLDAAPDVAALRAGCPDLRVLLTSRAPLRLQVEQIYPVQPLATPPAHDPGPLAPPALDALRGVLSVRLFVARARAVRPDFAVTPGNGWAVAEICRHLDGLPLAIELAAARTTVLSPQALLVQLAHPLRLLTGGARDLPERQRTLRTAIAWSYDLLPAEEQMFFRHVSVFAGSGDLAAVEAVCRTGPSFDVLESVSALAAANLLVVEAGDDPRSGMLETIREFARERLAASGGEEEIRARHAAHYLALAESAAKFPPNSGQGEIFRRLDRELENFRTALSWARDSGNVSTLLRLASALFYFWYILGYPREGTAWLEAGLALTAPDDRSPERAAALAAAGGLANILGDLNGGRRELEESVALWRELGGGCSLALALSHLGITYWALGEHEKAWAACEESIAVARADGDALHVALGLHGLGVMLAWWRGDFVGAAARFEEARAVFQGLGPTVGLSVVANSLGDLARQRGAYAQAQDHYRESLEVARATESKSQEAIVLHNLGYTLHCLHDDQNAQESFRQSLSLFREMGDIRGVAECVAGFACLAADAHPERTVCWLHAARAAVAAIGTELFASNESQYEAALTLARARLGSAAVDEALAAEAIPLEMAIRETDESG